MLFLKNNITVKLLHVYQFDRPACKNDTPERDFHALSYRIRSNTTFRLPNQQVHAPDNAITYIPAHMAYQIETEYEDVIVARFEIVGGGGNFEVFYPDNSAIFGDLFQRMLTAWENKKYGYRYLCTALLYQIFSLLEVQSEESTHHMLRRKINNATEYIHNHFLDCNISIHHLAEMCAMSETSFRKIFLTVFQTTPLKYINQLRVNHAQELLQSGDCTVAEAAEKSGFTDVKYFSVVFKAWKGKPPSHFMT